MVYTRPTSHEAIVLNVTRKLFSDQPSNWNIKCGITKIKLQHHKSTDIQISEETVIFVC